MTCTTYLHVHTTDKCNQCRHHCTKRPGHHIISNPNQSNQSTRKTLTDKADSQAKRVALVGWWVGHLTHLTNRRAQESHVTYADGRIGVCVGLHTSLSLSLSLRPFVSFLCVCVGVCRLCCVVDWRLCVI